MAAVWKGGPAWGARRAALGPGVQPPLLSRLGAGHRGREVPGTPCPRLLVSSQLRVGSPLAVGYIEAPAGAQGQASRAGAGRGGWVCTVAV